MQPIIPFMGSCGGSLTSEITGEDGGLSVLSLSSGSTSDSSVKHAASVPRSADRLGPGDLYMRCKDRQQINFMCSKVGKLEVILSKNMKQLSLH